MTSHALLIFVTILLFGMVCVACTESSPTDLEAKTEMLTRSWKGEEFFLITIDDSTFLGKDFVVTFDFSSDGSYFLYQYTMSSYGRIGQWKFEDQGGSISLSADHGYSEVFDIRELTSSLFVMGDTNSRGYRLVPSSQ